VGEFVSRLPLRVNTLGALLAEHNLEELRRVLHQIKGAGSGFGFPDVTSLAARAEGAVKAGEALNEIVAKVQDLVQLMRRIEGYQSSREQCGATADRSDHR
jgi:HPt (histidine-containing phosphotransfer) domain-containing protein